MADDMIEKWEDHFEQGKRESRQERKKASNRDRSKFKKTDQKKEGLELDLGNLKGETREGRILSITAQGAKVQEGEETTLCVIRGTLMQENRRLKNLVTVGDFVYYVKTSEEEGVIVGVKPRFSVLSRADTLVRRREQLLAANIDQVLITVSVVKPLLKPFLVDRYIIAARLGNMVPVIVVNKIDLLSEGNVEASVRRQEKETLEKFVQAYEEAGVHVIPISAESGEGIEHLREVMRGRASVFSGQSGVGKSSLINMMTGLDLKVGGVVDRTLKGSHTTSTAHLIPLEGGGFCIDTPGIKSFGIWDLEIEDVKNHFPEFVAVADQCKFPNCSHLHEADCAVMRGVEDGTISAMRFESYVWLIQSLSEEYRRR